MKRIGIITICKVKNYGAELQAFALQRKLIDLGVDAEIIDYSYYKNSRHIASPLSKPLIKLPLLKRIKEFLFPIIQKIDSLRSKRDVELRDKAFDDFHKFNTQFSEEYRTVDSLYQQPMEYDIFMTGSDQVWNPGSGSSIKPYFLDFVKGDKKRVSYAASFGVNNLSSSWELIVKDMLSKYETIGIREESGANIVKKILPNRVVQVLDPTLLLTKEEWVGISESYSVKGDFILVYDLFNSKYLSSLALSVAKKEGIKVIRLSASAKRSDNPIMDALTAGPAEFIDLFSRAKYVLTNSFHGTAFALNFNIPFYSIVRKGQDNSSRQYSLLNQVSLLNRILKEDSLSSEELNWNINFDDANVKLQNERNKSIQYLKEVVEL